MTIRKRIGNLTVIFRILIAPEEENKIELRIIGNLLQAFDNFLGTLSDSVSKLANIDNIGSILQSIGNSLQSLSGVLMIKGKDGDLH